MIYAPVWFSAVETAWLEAARYDPPARRALLPQGQYRRPATVIWSPYSDLPTFRGQPHEWWPQLVPRAEYADFSYDATNDLAPTDAIVGLSLVVAPSGVGEVVISRLALFAPALVSVWLTGGVAGRVYTYELVITTAELRTIAILIGQRCAPVLAYVPIPPPPNPGFGGLTTWP